MTPADFREFVLRLPIKSDFAVAYYSRWRPSGTKLLAARKCGCGDGKIRRAGKEAYVRAGFSKIHLDASMSCADDPIPLAPETVAERAAVLCLAAEAWRQNASVSN